MRFFEPTNKFLDWLVKLAGRRPVIDCGCGEGHVVEALVKRGVNALGVDSAAFPEDGCTMSRPIVKKDAATFDFPSGCIVLFCRPCHSDWVETTIKNAKRNADVILYVGLERNLEDDLGRFADPGQFAKVGRNAGKEREGVWALRIRGAEVTRWCLVQTPSWSAPYWVENTPDYWVNLAGGRCPKHKNDKVLDSMLTDDIHQLDWSRTGHVQPNSEAGWLDREGKFHGCDRSGHNDYADLVLGSSEQDLLETGWCHVYGKGERCVPNFHCDTDLSAEQRNYLQSNGYSGILLELEDDRMLEPVTGKPYSNPVALRKVEKTGD